MMRAPDLAAIHAAELSVARSRRMTHESLHRVPAAVRATLTRPTTVMLAMGFAGILGLCLVRRSRHKSLTAGSRPTASPSPAKVVAVFLTRFGLHYLGLLIRQIWAAQVPTATRDVDASSKSPASAYSVRSLRS